LPDKLPPYLNAIPAVSAAAFAVQDIVNWSSQFQSKCAVATHQVQIACIFVSGLVVPIQTLPQFCTTIQVVKLFPDVKYKSSTDLTIKSVCACNCSILQTSTQSFWYLVIQLLIQVQLKICIFQEEILSVCVAVNVLATSFLVVLTSYACTVTHKSQSINAPAASTLVASVTSAESSIQSSLVLSQSTKAHSASISCFQDISLASNLSAFRLEKLLFRLVLKSSAESQLFSVDIVDILSVISSYLCSSSIYCSTCD
jgi:hypothetical protein